MDRKTPQSIMPTVLTLKQGVSAISVAAACHEGAHSAGSACQVFSSKSVVTVHVVAQARPARNTSDSLHVRFRTKCVSVY